MIQEKQESFDISREFRKSNRQSQHFQSNYEIETRKELEKLLFENSTLRTQKIELQTKIDEIMENVRKLEEKIEQNKSATNEELSTKNSQI